MIATRGYGANQMITTRGYGRMVIRLLREVVRRFSKIIKIISLRSYINNGNPS